MRKDTYSPAVPNSVLKQLLCFVVYCSAGLRCASLKLMPRFGTPFQNAFVVRLHRKPPQTGRLLPRIGRLFLKKRKASSKERWIRTHISFRNAVQLCLRIAFTFRPSTFAFVSEFQTSDGRVSESWYHFYKTRTVYSTVNFELK